MWWYENCTECTFLRDGVSDEHDDADVDFQVLMVVASGLIVRLLRVFENNNYQNIK